MGLGFGDLDSAHCPQGESIFRVTNWISPDSKLGSCDLSPCYFIIIFPNNQNQRRKKTFFFLGFGIGGDAFVIESRSRDPFRARREYRETIENPGQEF